MITLLQSSGNPAVDQAIVDVIAAFEQTFPGRVSGFYALGSYADSSAITTSDIDLTIIFSGAFASDEERDTAQRMATTCAAASLLELDIELDDEASLALGASPQFKLGSALLYGDDIRARVPLVSLTWWTRDRMHSSWWRVARLFARPAVITPPLDYPEPAARYLGYTRRPVRLPDGRMEPGTRDLIRLTGWAATALLAHQCGVYVARKGESHTLYRQQIGGEWADLLDDIYALCRLRWSYRIPPDPAEQEQLRAICAQTLDFERHFLAIYRPYLLDELHGADPAGALFAAEMLQRAPLCDPVVIAALATLAERDGEPVAPVARAALAKLTKLTSG